jgi:hypothetical protein
VDGTGAEALEERLAALHAAVREAALAGDQDRTQDLLAELAAARQDWDAEIAGLEGQAGTGTAADPRRPGSLLTVREQVHEALSLLRVPAQPRLLAKAHGAFFATGLRPERLTSLRRDEESSFTAAPFARPYYLCAALSAEHLSPSRGLLAISTWPLERRVIGPRSPTADHLTAAISIAIAVQRLPSPPRPALALLAEVAGSVRGAVSAPGPVSPESLIQAARAHLEELRDGDDADRSEGAGRARDQLNQVELLFGRPPPFRPEPPGRNGQPRRAASPAARQAARPGHGP